MSGCRPGSFASHLCFSLTRLELTISPSEIVPLLKQSLRAKGLHIGRYTIIPASKSKSHASTNGNASHQPEHSQHPSRHPESRENKEPKQKEEDTHARIRITDLIEPDHPTPKYEFEMDLSLRETSRGRWNKLSIEEYRSINLATGEVMALGLKHQKPFYFSK